MSDISHVLAHGIGGRQDLPIPLGLAVTGAGLAVLVSFAVMAVLWKGSRLRGDASGRQVPPAVERVVDSAALRAVLRVLGLAGTAFFVVVAAYGPPDSLVNPAAGIVYVFFWVGLIPLSLLFGPVWRLFNPLRTLHLVLARLVGSRPEDELARLPSRIGYWPAALGLLAFTWLELVAPAGEDPRVLLTFLGAYGGIHVLAAAVFGSGWFDRADAFEAYSTLAGRLAPLGRRTDGRLVVRNPFDGLDGLRLDPGLVALVCVWLGSTAFDGFSRSVVWVGLLELGVASPVVVRSVAFVSTIVIAAALYVGCTAVATRWGTGDGAAMPQQFAHSLVPIAIGYTVAHYFSLLVFTGQRTAVQLSDPFGTGSDLFGTATYQPWYGLPPSVIAVIQVSAVVCGHVLGVVAAHDRAARIFSRRQAVAGQVPLLVLMVGYTVGGLTLLFAA